MVEQNSFQNLDGGSNPTSPLQFVEEISKDVFEGLVGSYHYLGAKPFRATKCYGLFYGMELIGGLCFHGISAPETVVGAFGLPRTDQSGFYEIGRLVLKPNFNGKNLGSFLISHAVRLFRKSYNVRAIITYADSSRHDGGIYRASNFTYCGLSTPKKDFYVNGKIQERGKTKGILGEWRSRPQKHRYIIVFDRVLFLKWPVQQFIKGIPNAV